MFGKNPFVMCRKSLLVLFLALVATVLSAQELRRVEDLCYKPSGDAYEQERCRLDVIWPAGAEDLPVVVWFHGGGLTGGDRRGTPAALLDGSYVVVRANYRLIPNVEVKDCIDDAAAAVAWAFKHVSDYGGSVDKIFVSGHSAGGYLTDMIGLDKHYLAAYGIDADRIAGLIPFSGQVISHFAYRKTLGMGELQPSIDPYAPLYHIRPDAPPIVIVSGDREMELYGRYEETAYFWRMLKLVGHPDVHIYELQGYNHGNMADPAVQILKDHVKRILSKK